MACYDVFNGDADGICALQQLRLQTPKDAVCITGLKRDINLLSRVDTKAGDEITVLDISLDKNRPALDGALNAGAKVFYADHHFPGEIPEHENLDIHIDVSAETCTSLIVNEYLGGTQARWAVVGAFGDNFDVAATKLAQSIGLGESELAEYKQLGICLNYNGYGFELNDLMFHPADLYALLSSYKNPGDFTQNVSGYEALYQQYQTDMAMSQSVLPDTKTETTALFLLPNEPWARRIVGVMGNDLAKDNPDRAHALLVDMGDGHYRVSVRAPYNTKSGADELCRQFESGGGRKAAAGINRLPGGDLVGFNNRFLRAFLGAE